MRNKEKISNLNDNSIKERFRDIMRKGENLRKQQLINDLNNKRFFSEQENKEFIKARDLAQGLKKAKKKDDEENDMLNWQEKDNSTKYIEQILKDDELFLQNQIDTLIKTKSEKIFNQIIKLMNEFCYYSNKVISYCFDYLIKIYDNGILINDEECINQCLYMITNCITFKSSQEIEQGLSERLYYFVTDENFHSRNPSLTKPQCYYALYLLNVGADNYLPISKDKSVILIKSIINEIRNSLDQIYFCNLSLKLMNSFIKSDLFYNINNKSDLRNFIEIFLDSIFQFYDTKILNQNFEKLKEYLNDNSNIPDITIFQHLSIYTFVFLFSSFLVDDNETFRIIFNEKRVQKIQQMFELYECVDDNDLIIVPMILLILNMAESKSLLFKNIYLSNKVKNFIIGKEYRNNFDKVMNIIQTLQYILNLNNEEISSFYLKDKNLWSFINDQINSDNDNIIEELLNLILIILELIRKYNKLELTVILMFNKYELNTKIEKLFYKKGGNKIPEKATSIIGILNNFESNKMLFDN